MPHYGSTLQLPTDEHKYIWLIEVIYRQATWEEEDCRERWHVTGGLNMAGNQLWGDCSGMCRTHNIDKSAMAYGKAGGWVCCAGDFACLVY